MATDQSNFSATSDLPSWGSRRQRRRVYRELIITTPGLAESIGGAILYDETIRQQKKDGTSFIKAAIDAGIIPGIKVDAGAKAARSGRPSIAGGSRRLSQQVRPT
ncbi:MAG: class I fructose-bisphosphate aldolase [Candidatus Acidiferrum sp.]